MAKTVIIDPRFCGPPEMGNGGYVCGILAQRVGKTAEVTLRNPAPLGQPLIIGSFSGNVTRLKFGDKVIAEARPAQFNLGAPGPPAFEEAINVSKQYPTKQHPFPHCFVCGPQRIEGDGLRIFPGLVHGQNFVAAPWVPNQDLADKSGFVKSEFMWAALDCPGGIAVIVDRPRPILLGQLTATIISPVRVGEQCVVIGWIIAGEGRKHITGTAVYSEAGQLCAKGKAVWIEPKSTF